jgi:hypothetical protein
MLVKLLSLSVAFLLTALCQLKRAFQNDLIQSFNFLSVFGLKRVFVLQMFQLIETELLDLLKW